MPIDKIEASDLKLLVVITYVDMRLPILLYTRITDLIPILFSGNGTLILSELLLLGLGLKITDSSNCTFLLPTRLLRKSPLTVSKELTAVLIHYTLLLII